MENKMEEESVKIERCDLDFNDFEGLKQKLDRFDKLFVIEEKITSKNKVKFVLDENKDFVMNVVRSAENPEGVNYTLTEEAIYSVFKNIGVAKKCVDSNIADNKELLCSILNSVYGDKEEEFKALHHFNKVTNKEVIDIYTDVEYQNYSIGDTLYSAFNNSYNNIKEAVFVNPAISFKDGFSCFIFFDKKKSEVKMDKEGTETDFAYIGAYIKLPVIRKPKIEVRPAVLLEKAQKVWICKGTRYLKKGKEKTIPLDEWISNNVGLCIAKAQLDISVNIEKAVEEECDRNGYLSDKYKDVIKHAVENCRVSKASKEGVIDNCLHSKNILQAALSILELGKELDPENDGFRLRKEKIAISAGNVIAHSHICNSCLMETDDDE